MALVDLINQYTVNNLNQDTVASQNLGKDDFLQLLVMQLKNQDPLEPLKNEEFIAQLAQFTSLEQMTNLNKNFEGMMALQGLSYASSFIGREVAWYDEEGQVLSGTVLEVELEGESPMLNIEGQYLITPGEVITIGQ